MALDLSVLANVLRDDVRPDIVDTIQKKAKMYQYFQKSNEPVQVGGNWFIRFKTAQGLGVAYVEGDTASNGHLPPKLSMAFNRFTVTPKYFYGQGEVTGLAMLRGDGSLNKIGGDLLSQIKQDITESITKQLNRVVFSDGNEALATLVSTGNGGLAWTIFNSSNMSATGNVKEVRARYLQAGMKVALHNGVGAVRSNGVVTITSVNHTANTCVVDAAVSGATASDKITLSRQGTDIGSYGIGAWGLEYHVDDGSNISTYQGVGSRSSVDRACASVISNSGTLRPLSRDLMEQLILRRTVRSNKSKDDAAMIMMDVGMVQEFAKLYEGQVRYAPYELLGGTKKEMLRYGTFAIDDDVDCPYHTIYFITPDAFKFQELEDLKFVDYGDGILVRDTGSDNMDKAFFTMRAVHNLACECPVEQAKLTDISQTIIPG
jgi:hypothetical protein